MWKLVIHAGQSGRFMRCYVTLMLRAALTILLTAGWLRAADAPPSEYKLKAAFLFHFSQFVDWPAGSYADAKAPFVIGVLGKNPFATVLEQTIHGKSVGNHAITVQEFSSLAEATNNCQILFISSSEQQRLPEIFASLAGANILTVGEADNFGAAGGMIHFVLEGSKIRFRVNEVAATRARLKISAKLLSLASRTER
jgi:hypothetical protein